MRDGEHASHRAKVRTSPPPSGRVSERFAKVPLIGLVAEPMGEAERRGFALALILRRNRFSVPQKRVFTRARPEATNLLSRPKCSLGTPILPGVCCADGRMGRTAPEDRCTPMYNLPQRCRDEWCRRRVGVELYTSDTRPGGSKTGDLWSHEATWLTSGVDDVPSILLRRQSDDGPYIGTGLKMTAVVRQGWTTAREPARFRGDR